jgi:uncharacterized protein YbaA (DUF1428 family)
MTDDRHTTTAAEPQGYADLYLLPVPEAALEDYRRQATAFGQVVRELGALGYREFLADDVGDGLKALATADGTVLTAAIAEFTSREHRDEVMERVLADPRVTALMEGDQIADMDAMRYGGFRTFVEAR